MNDRPTSWNGHAITYDKDGNADISALCESCARDYEDEQADIRENEAEAQAS